MSNNNTSVVYKHIRLDTNDVFYIGIGNEKRPLSKNRKNKHWRSIVDKVGYNVEIVCKDLSWSEAVEIEKYLISYYGRKDLKLGNLCNQTNGGEGQSGGIGRIGKKHSEETKLKIGVKSKGRFFSEKVRTQMSNSHKGMKQSLESIEKIRQSKFKNATTESELKKMNQVILNIETGVFYNSVREAAKYNNIPYSTLRCHIDNSNNRFNLKYV